MSEKKKKQRNNLGINLTKEVKELYTGNYKMLITEIEGGSKKWNGVLCSCIGRVTVKMAVLPKAIYRFMRSQSKYQGYFSQNYNK